MLAHRGPGVVRPTEVAEGPVTISDADVAAFADMIVHQPLSAARAHLDGLRDRGLSAEAVITSVLSATARHLGLLWEQDRCTFVDVTVGLSRLQQLLRVYGPAFEVSPAPVVERGRILLAVVPGEQHTFGLAVVEEFFRRAGWHVQSEFLPSKPILIEHVRTEWFDLVGLSASGEVSAAGVASVVKAVRAASLNTSVRVMLGGNLFVMDPGLALSLGADLGARDAAEAVSRVDWMLETKKSSC
ncbi:B12-binding domain-containing protein [Bosea sp. (in: a-proteobacteria)]|uniref:cobalamin B12-binding domain-containing protein n=1 Tax=Bosea sp. (in: a-proteobacteria) TaxID=1871050 RepID=UPI0027358C51|nr:cobalamin B12-binding domain-containing protein [Bosea sp. (in: a-proteobacteria)]MDP3254949.1 cobalamin B12-binding domain-containing protein [Bosea sp. (in: a-proteobacteria)]